MLKCMGHPPSKVCTHAWRRPRAATTCVQVGAPRSLCDAIPCSLLASQCAAHADHGLPACARARCGRHARTVCKRLGGATALLLLLLPHTVYAHRWSHFDAQLVFGSITDTNLQPLEFPKVREEEHTQWAHARGLHVPMPPRGRMGTWHGLHACGGEHPRRQASTWGGPMHCGAGT